MLIGVVSVFLIFAVVNGDVYNEIRTAEEKRHNETLSEYLKAAFGGALDSLFPSVTDTEKAETDKLFGDVFPIGDPSRPLPDDETKIEALLCRDHRERGKKILKYVRKRYPTHLITQVSVSICVHSVGEKNDEYCKDAASRSVYTSNATIINQHISALNEARNKYINNSLVIVHGNHTEYKIAMLCCAYFNLKTQVANAMPTEHTKKFVKDYMDGYNGPTIKYLCVYHSEGSKACAELVMPAPPTNVTRFTSIFSAAVESVSKLTSIK